MTCARLIIAAGISEVHWRELYRDDGGLELLREAAVESFHVYDA
jgi:deoxycytidylate deaminase